jgi:hypothetical protein
VMGLTRNRARVSASIDKEKKQEIISYPRLPVGDEWWSRQLPTEPCLKILSS